MGGAKQRSQDRFVHSIFGKSTPPLYSKGPDRPFMRQNPLRNLHHKIINSDENVMRYACPRFRKNRSKQYVEDLDAAWRIHNDNTFTSADDGRIGTST